MKWIDDLNMSANGSQYIFPDSPSMITHLREKKVNEVIKLLWPETNLRAIDFKKIFLNEMIACGYYRIDFIKQLMSGFKSNKNIISDWDEVTAAQILQRWLDVLLQYSNTPHHEFGTI